MFDVSTPYTFNIIGINQQGLVAATAHVAPTPSRMGWRQLVG